MVAWPNPRTPAWNAGWLNIKRARHQDSGCSFPAIALGIVGLVPSISRITLCLLKIAVPLVLRHDPDSIAQIDTLQIMDREDLIPRGIKVDIQQNTGDDT